MATILLHEPVPISDRLERLHLFPGRHLGEDELDQLQDYADARLAPLLSGRRPGIVRGLEVRAGRPEADGEAFVVTPGLAVAGNGQALGLYLPVRQTWQTLIDEYLAGGASSAAGVFYLTLRRSDRSIDAGPGVDPCRRAEADPTRDTRLVVLGTLGLRRLAIPGDAAVSESRERIENWLAADRVEGELLQTMANAVPLGLVAIEAVGDQFQVRWFSREAGRYLSLAHSGYRVLLAQVEAAFRRVLAQRGDDPRPLGQYLDEELELDFLPAAGRLPAQLLQNPAAPTPSLLWLPSHLHVDMVPVPEESVEELVERHLARRVVDLRQPAGDGLRLLLAVNETDYRRDLLDFPQTDAQLERDLFRYFIRAHNAWLDWYRQFDHLYHLGDEDVLDADELAALKLPEPVESPAGPEAVFTGLIAEAERELGGEEGAPYPYTEGAPEPPPFYNDWLVADPADPQGSPVPPAPPVPARDGLVIQYLLNEQAIERVDSQIRATRSRLEKTRDYILLQRQQMDAQTVSLAALGGGVAGDGSGLQVARWLPFTEMKMQPPSETPVEKAQAPVAPPPSSGAGSVSGRGGTSIWGTTGWSSGAWGAATSGYGFPSYGTTAARSYEKIADVLPRTKSGPAGPAKVSEPALAIAIAGKPSQVSSLEYGLGANRLNRLTEASRQAFSKPAFATKEYRFGVLDQIRPEVKEYKMAYQGMQELIATLDGLFDPQEASSIRTVLRGFGKLRSPEELAALDRENGMAEVFATMSRYFDAGKIAELRSKMLEAESLTQQEEETLRRTGEVPLNEDKRLESYQAHYAELFKAGKVLTRQIAYMEGRYNRIEALLERRLKERVRRESERERLTALIAEARETLETLDKRRIEYLGDYGVAQRLIDEDWRQAHDVNEERTLILTERLHGLYFVRVRPTPITAALADPLALRHGKAGDIVPGCDWVEDPELPASLDEFFDAVLEVPIDDWAPLRPLRVRLPDPVRIDDLYALRRARFDRRTQGGRDSAVRTVVSTRLQALSVQSRAVMQQLSAAVLPATRGSLKAFQQGSARVLSLEDVLSGTGGPLCRAAQQLRDRLEQCQACLLDQLDLLPPSIRLEWGQLAEDDRIDVEHTERWPGLQRAEREDFNAVRTLAELVAWWFRQLSGEASGAGRAAMRNMIRACLIHASLGDPVDMVHGRVQVPPRRLATGEALRLKLNRATLPGTRLQLLDRGQGLVATLVVDDQDERGAVANVVRVAKSGARVDTGFTVVAGKSSKRLL